MRAYTICRIEPIMNEPNKKSRKKLSFTSQVVLGVLLGVLVGLFFGEAILGLLGESFRPIGISVRTGANFLFCANAEIDKTKKEPTRIITHFFIIISSVSYPFSAASPTPGLDCHIRVCHQCTCVSMVHE